MEYRNRALRGGGGNCQRGLPNNPGDRGGVTAELGGGGNYPTSETRTGMPNAEWNAEFAT